MVVWKYQHQHDALLYHTVEIHSLPLALWVMLLGIVLKFKIINFFRIQIMKLLFRIGYSLFACLLPRLYCHYIHLDHVIKIIQINKLSCKTTGRHTISFFYALWFGGVIVLAQWSPVYFIHLRHKEEENKKIKKIIHFSIKNQRSYSVLQKSINTQKALTIQLIFLHNYQHHYNHHSHLLLKTNFSCHNFYWLASDFGLGGVAYIVDKPVCNSYYGPIDSGL